MPDGSNITDGTAPVSFPKAVLNDNCSLTVTGPTGSVLWRTNTTSTGPCDLVMSPNGTMSIIDVGHGNTTLWSNANDFINTTATCAPYSVTMLTSGKLVETDCNNQTVFEAPGILPPGGYTELTPCACVCSLPAVLWPEAEHGPSALVHNAKSFGKLFI